jgi:hypothetical protein
MRKSSLLLLSALVVSGMTFAQDYYERVYIYSPFPTENEFTLDQCIPAGNFGLIPTVGGRFDLYSLQTKKTNGIVLNDKVKRVGGLLVCQDWNAWSPVNNTVPVYWEISIDGMDMVAVGLGTPELPGGGVVLNAALPSSFLMNISANILYGSPGVAGGTVTSSVVLDYSPDGSSEYPTEALQVIRLYTPIAE